MLSIELSYVVYIDSFSIVPSIPNQSSLDDKNRQGYYRGVLNHLQQTGKIKVHDYFDTEHFNGTRIQYKSHVSLRHIQSGKEITGSSCYVQNKSEAREKAAENAYSYILAVEFNMGAVAVPKAAQDGKG